MAKHRTDHEWASILSDFRRSGLSQSAFCHRRGLALSTFRLRLTEARRNALPLPSGENVASGQPALIEIPLSGSLRDGVAASGSGHGIPVEIEFPGGARASLGVQTGTLGDNRHLSTKFNTVARVGNALFPKDSVRKRVLPHPGAWRSP